MQNFEEPIFNRFERVLEKWIALHDEEFHFPADSDSPQIKICGDAGVIRANDAWSKLPKHLKEAMVAHEVGHYEYAHHTQPITNPFFRLGFVLRNEVLPRELEADGYAARLLGRENYLLALRQISTMSYHSESGKKELLLRIAALEKNVSLS